MEFTLAWLRDLVSAMWSYPAVKVIASHIMFNTIVAVAANVHAKTFTLGRFGEFLARKILPYATVYFASELLGEAIGMHALSKAVWAVIEMSLLGDLLDNLTKLGIKLPDSISRLVVK
jgi:hypothetical protein